MYSLSGNECVKARLIDLDCLRPKPKVCEKTHRTSSGYALELQCAAPNAVFLRPFCLPEAVLPKSNECECRVGRRGSPQPAASLSELAQRNSNYLLSNNGSKERAERYQLLSRRKGIEVVSGNR